MSKADIMRLANELLTALMFEEDEDFVFEILAAVANNETYGEDEIAAAEREEDN